jgi:hypothetical protein
MTMGIRTVPKVESHALQVPDDSQQLMQLQKGEAAGVVASAMCNNSCSTRNAGAVHAEVSYLELRITKGS